MWVARAAWVGLIVKLVLDPGGVFKVLLAAVLAVLIIWELARGVRWWRARRRAD
jgi:hypothetical protein